MGLDIKLVLIGHKNVGKTALFNRYIYNDSPDTQMTVGAYFASKNININQAAVKLDVWDTAGEEKFDSLTTYYCKGAQAAVICYDLTSKTTFDNLPHWVEKIKDQANDDCVICIVGNKSDLVEQDPSQRKVTTEQGEEYAKSIGALFFEVSARSGANVEKAFLKAATDATKKVGGFEDHDKVNLKANKGKTTCC